MQLEARPRHLLGSNLHHRRLDRHLRLLQHLDNQRRHPRHLERLVHSVNQRRHLLRLGNQRQLRRHLELLPHRLLDSPRRHPRRLVSLHSKRHQYLDNLQRHRVVDYLVHRLLHRRRLGHRLHRRLVRQSLCLVGELRHQHQLDYSEHQLRHQHQLDYLGHQLQHLVVDYLGRQQLHLVHRLLPHRRLGLRLNHLHLVLQHRLRLVLLLRREDLEHRHNKLLQGLRQLHSQQQIKLMGQIQSYCNL